MKFNIITFGCKVNQYESNVMKEIMLHHNFSYEENLANCNILIVNTCTVTNVADKKCLKMIRHLRKNYPKAILVVAGCSSQNKQDLYQEMDIDILIGNKDKSKIADLLNKYISSKKRYVKFYNDRNLEFENMNINTFNHVRAFIKIEDGCDNFCSYCIIPYVRGSVRCKEFSEVIKEATNLANNKYYEIVLTGIHTGRYNSNGLDLSDLINELSKIDNLKRIRISSIEITELDDKFLETLKNNPKVCNHLHIPLQSGSDEILKKMNRKYDLKYFEDKVNKIRSIRPDISISTDIIVGHPYEKEENFQECLNFAKKIKFSKIHVFPYSVRKGTAAEKMPEQVSEKIKKERVKKLIELSNKLEEEYFNKFKGKTVDVLIEECDNLNSMGHTSNYLYVKLNEKLEKGQIYSRVL